MTTPLYTTDILRLAASTANVGRLSEAQGTAQKRSAICGSTVVVDICVDSQGCVSAVGMEIRACALGQASAALMSASCLGKSVEQLESARDELAGWLSGDRRTAGDWPGLNIFAPALPKTARHPAIMLAFEAVAEAARVASHAASQTAVAH